MVEGADNAFLLSKLLAEIIYNKKKDHLPIECRIDNRSLFQAAHSTNTLNDKRLRIEMSIVREMLERKEINLTWVETKEQIADVLTKNGASNTKLLKTLQEGFLNI